MKGDEAVPSGLRTIQVALVPGAIFFAPDNRSVAYSFGRELPVTAKVVKADDGDGFPPPGTIVQILQAECTDDGSVVLGFVHDGGDCVCMLEDVEVIAYQSEGS